MRVSDFLKSALLCISMVMGVAQTAHAQIPTGNYSGAYLGADHGTVSISVDSYGAVKCTLKSDTGKGTVTANGSIFSVDPVLMNCYSSDPDNYLSLDGDYEDGKFTGGYLFVGPGKTNYTGHYSAGRTTASSNELSWRSLSGLWYDPAYTSTGFNILGADNGLIFTYYGRNAAGAQLWMISMDALGGAIQANTEYTIQLGMTTAGTFAAPVYQMERWGQISVKFSSCTNATATLTGKDGTQVLNLKRLSGVKDANGC
ncbi:hypothetical protein G7048_09995 [Diaphorobacter sp. HDW4B]|uniref:hypothetical protein n=1 Tax=Diaphorobacter sp. HDW4B TaxID=2714925 RepID=UPI00140AD127|nr:hypothetical protein [Diaphorobacter sp. HDW4B]QIL70661.1 hypothetical protein G7048_09995 [Diaphorobacter sp. HDW4B]